MDDVVIQGTETKVLGIEGRCHAGNPRLLLHHGERHQAVGYWTIENGSCGSLFAEYFAALWAY